MADPSIDRFSRVVAVAHAHLEERRQEINDANVFPVADGDTGDNMAGTIKAVRDALENLRTSSLASVDRNLIVTTVAHAALMGARGNSGVILSQIVRGAAEVLTTRRGELIGPALVRDALGAASAAAWTSVGDPQEGTMLTVIREVHEAVAATVAELEETELPDDVTDSVQDAMFAELMGVAIIAGLTALERTPEQLEVLAEAEVVDAGAYGLMVMLGGLVAGLAGIEGPSQIPHQSGATFGGGTHFDSRYQYCTSCIVTGRELDPKQIVPRLEELGDSVAVVGDSTMLKVHVHADDRDRVKLICSEYGDIDQFEATDMHAQVAARTADSGGIAAAPEALETRAPAWWRWLRGRGLPGSSARRALLSSMAARPSTPRSRRSSPASARRRARRSILLPNSPNVVMAAKEAARLAERPAHVLPSVAQQAGLAALIAYDASATAADNVTRMEAELDAIATGLVPRRTVTTPTVAIAAATRSASWAKTSWPGATRRRPCGPCSRASATAPRSSRSSKGERRRSRPASSISTSTAPSSRSWTEGSPRTGGCSRPSEQPDEGRGLEETHPEGGRIVSVPARRTLAAMSATSLATRPEASPAAARPRAIGTGAELGDDALRAIGLRSTPHPSRLDAPITALKGAGPKLAEVAAGIGIASLGDLLWHLPHGYRDRTSIREVGDLRIGEEATVMVTVKSARVRPTRRRSLRIVEASVADATGPMKAVWFNQAWLAEKLTPGTKVLMHGRHDRSGFRVEAYEIAEAGAEPGGIHTTGIVPSTPPPTGSSPLACGSGPAWPSS